MNLNIQDILAIGLLVLFVNDILVIMGCHIFFLENKEYYCKKK